MITLDLPAEKINDCNLDITGVNDDVPRLPIRLLLAYLQQDLDL